VIIERFEAPLVFSNADLVREQRQRTGVLAAIKTENIQPTVREALAAAVELLDAPAS
jgi:hypothetical protein